MSSVKVSIILPTYNGQQFISKAIESILKQTFSEWELLVLSDGSTDDTKGIVETFLKNDARIIFVENEKNIGIQKTLNEGLQLARGKYIARIDDDDEWIEALKLERQFSFLETHEKYVLVGTEAFVTDEYGENIVIQRMPITDKAIRNRILSKNCFLHSSILMRTETVRAVGGYTNKSLYLHVEDYELWLRLGRVGKFCNLPQQSVKLVVRSTSLTANNRLRQAKNSLSISLRYRKAYPNFIFNYFISLMRVLFFMLIIIIPLPSSTIYKIQTIYKSL